MGVAGYESIHRAHLFLTTAKNVDAPFQICGGAGGLNLCVPLTTIHHQTRQALKSSISLVSQAPKPDQPVPHQPAGLRCRFRRAWLEDGLPISSFQPEKICYLCRNLRCMTNGSFSRKRTFRSSEFGRNKGLLSANCGPSRYIPQCLLGESRVAIVFC